MKLMSFDCRVYQVWKSFSLQFDNKISFENGMTYRLSGSNGSGKSSFIKRVLIPELQKSQIRYLYVEQQVQNQLYAIKADAAIKKYAYSINDDGSVVDYLLQSLIEAEPDYNNPCVFILDETQHYQKVYDFIYTTGMPFVVVIVSHQELLESIQYKSIHFELQIPSLSLIKSYESSM